MTSRIPAGRLHLQASPRISQQCGRRDNDGKNFGVHAVSFQVVSKAIVPECVRCPPGYWHDAVNCPIADIECKPEARQHFPMVHFGSATSTVIDKPAVEHEPEVTIESDDDSLIYPQRFIDNEPPFEQSFMDNMPVQLGVNVPEQQVVVSKASEQKNQLVSFLEDSDGDDDDLVELEVPEATVDEAECEFTLRI
ncbi:hypothetical protein CYMTET_17741 [Cymbomonas tetramitiformis]|uniref:Uncharacterized protein n=1 Tax=Cymbomonas tetramitiformis TaxID=36881 RepID=A0AAE0L704_9CHLO|nr:hypothetical protein CYMTET_17741 [Cymbomonas tetramitiformis]